MCGGGAALDLDFADRVQQVHLRDSAATTDQKVGRWRDASACHGESGVNIHGWEVVLVAVV
jgi:hypothetical protein